MARRTQSEEKRPPKPTTPIKPGKKWVFRNGKWITIQDPAQQRAAGGGKKTLNSKVDKLVEKINALGGDKNDFIGGKAKGVRGSGYIDTPYGRIPATQVADGRPHFYPGPGKVPSRYKEGQETSILAKVWNDPEEYLAVQAALDADWGMTAPTGSLDGKTISAFKQVLGAANALGVTWRDLLFGDYAAGNGSGDDDSSSSSSSSGGGSGGGGGAIDFFDPEAARQAIDRSGVEQLGMNVDPEAREEIIAQLQAEAAAAEAAGQEYDLTAQINRKVKEKKPGDSALHNSFAIFDHFASVLGAGELFGGGGAGRPLTGPATGAGTGLR